MAKKLTISSAIFSNIFELVELVFGKKPLDKKQGALNIQCVKITKEHNDLLRSVTFWCAFRLNEMKQLCDSKKHIDAMVQQDARFLNAISHALAVQKDKEPQYDAWLFFNDNVQETNYFELSQCRPGTKDVISTLIIHKDR